MTYDSHWFLFHLHTLECTIQALIRTIREEGVGALYKGLGPNILRGMSMNVGMLACYDQAKEMVAKVTNDPMTNGPNLATKLGSSCIAVSTNSRGF